jgi:hypothetical protein
VRRRIDGEESEGGEGSEAGGTDIGGGRANFRTPGYTSRDHTELDSPSPFASTTSVLAMKPATDYIRHAAKLARKLQMDAAMGGTPQPDAEFFKALAKALDEAAAGLELVSRSE